MCSELPDRKPASPCLADVGVLVTAATLDQARPTITRKKAKPIV